MASDQNQLNYWFGTPAPEMRTTMAGGGPGRIPAEQMLENIRTPVAASSPGVLGTESPRFTLQKRIEDTPWRQQFKESKGYHDVDILDDSGKNIGEINLTAHPDGSKLFVDNVKVKGGSQTLGYSGMKDVQRQLSEMFPGVDITGQRVGGARFKNRPSDYRPPLSVMFPKVRLGDS